MALFSDMKLQVFSVDSINQYLKNSILKVIRLQRVLLRSVEAESIEICIVELYKTRGKLVIRKSQVSSLETCQTMTIQ
jgi:hypothetical protein